MTNPTPETIQEAFTQVYVTDPVIAQCRGEAQRLSLNENYEKMLIIVEMSRQLDRYRNGEIDTGRVINFKHGAD